MDLDHRGGSQRPEPDLRADLEVAGQADVPASLGAVVVPVGGLCLFDLQFIGRHQLAEGIGHVLTAVWSEQVAPERPHLFPRDPEDGGDGPGAARDLRQGLGGRHSPTDTTAVPTMASPPWPVAGSHRTSRRARASQLTAPAGILAPEGTARASSA